MKRLLFLILLAGSVSAQPAATFWKDSSGVLVSKNGDRISSDTIHVPVRLVLIAANGDSIIFNLAAGGTTGQVLKYNATTDSLYWADDATAGGGSGTTDSTYINDGTQYGPFTNDMFKIKENNGIDITREDSTDYDVFQFRADTGVVATVNLLDDSVAAVQAAAGDSARTAAGDTAGAYFPVDSSEITNKGISSSDLQDSIITSTHFRTSADGSYLLNKGRWSWANGDIVIEGDYTTQASLTFGAGALLQIGNNAKQAIVGNTSYLWLESGAFLITDDNDTITHFSGNGLTNDRTDSTLKADTTVLATQNALTDTASGLQSAMSDTARVAAGDTATVLRSEMGDTARTAVGDTATVLRTEMGDTARVAAGDTAAAYFPIDSTNVSDSGLSRDDINWEGGLASARITDQTIIKADMDTTSGFVFGPSHIGTSADGDSAIATHYYVNQAAGQVNPFFVGPFTHTGPQASWNYLERLNLNDLTATVGDTNIWFPQRNDSSWTTAADTTNYIGDSTPPYSMALHPSVLAIPGGYGPGAWPLVCVYSVIAKSESDENPFVAVANHQDVWVTPYQGTDSTEWYSGTDSATGIGYMDSTLDVPLFYWEELGGSSIDHLSDNDLYPTFDTLLYCDIRLTRDLTPTDSNYLFTTHTQDLITWSDTIRLFGGLVSNQIGDFISPSTVPWVNNSYLKFWVEEDEAQDTTGLYRLSSTSPTSWNLSDTSSCTINGLPTGYYIWHAKVKAFGVDELVILAACDSAGRSSQLGDSTELYIGVSHDAGHTWNFRSTPLISRGPTNSWYATRIYRSDFWFERTNSVINMKILMSASGGSGKWGTGVATVTYALTGTATDVDTTGTKIDAALNHRVPWTAIDGTHMDTLPSGDLWFKGFSSTNFDTTSGGLLKIKTGGVTSTEAASLSMSLDVAPFSSANLIGRLSDETGSGLAVFSTAPDFTTNIGLPSATAPTTSAIGDLAWDSNDSAFEVHDGTGSIIVPTRGTISLLIWDPEKITDTVPIFYADSFKYAGGITIGEIEIHTNVDGAYSLMFMTYTAADPPVFSTWVDTLVIGASDQRKQSTTFTDATLAKGQFLYMLTPSTDIDWLRVTIRYKVGQAS